MKLPNNLRNLLWGFCALLLFSIAVQQEGHAASAAAEEVVEDGPFYLEMKPLSVPIRRKNGNIRYYMFMTVSLEFDEKDKKDGTRKLIPRVRDAFLQDLSGRSVLHKDKTRGVDFEKVKDRLLKKAAKVLGKNAPSGVLVVKVYKGT
ncbi:MAG: flagellar basal body-associated FliL family protein [Sneathiella sp.]